MTNAEAPPMDEFLHGAYIGGWLACGICIPVTYLILHYPLALLLIFSLIWICIAPLPADPRSGGDSENPGGKS